MTPFVVHTGIGAPLERAHVNTDLIAPARFLLRSRSEGFSDVLFADLRGGGHGQSDAFVLDTPPFDRASVLVAGENFGCGSSREHAVWALMDYGFRAVVAPDFADIFHTNAIQNGLLVVKLPMPEIRALWDALDDAAGLEIAIDLPEQRVRYGDHAAGFEIDPYQKNLLLRGLSEIDVTLEDIAEIRAFERARAEQRPWLAHPKQAKGQEHG